MSSRLIADVAGWLGALTLVAAYYATSVGLLDSESGSYQLLNLVGSLGLGAVAWAHGTWPSFALNVLWLLIALAALTRTFRRPRTRSNRSPARPRRSPHGHPDLGHVTTHHQQGAPPCPPRPSFPRSLTSP